MTIKKQVYKIIQPHKSHDRSSTIFDWFIVSLIALNVLIIIFDTLNLPPRLSQTLRIIEIATVVIFTVEYILRLWTANLRYRNLSALKAAFVYALTFVMITDLIALLPFYLQFFIYIDLGILRIFRLFRMIWFFKIKREYIKVLSNIFDVFKQKAVSLLFSIFIIFVLMLIASVLMYTFERNAQPDAFDNAISGLWWAVTTITTIGYGDIYPITILGRALAGIYAILSIGLVAVPTGILSSGFIEKGREAKLANKKDKRFCPYCGEDLIDD